jgi:hypothetical protein
MTKYTYPRLSQQAPLVKSLDKIYKARLSRTYKFASSLHLSIVNITENWSTEISRVLLIRERLVGGLIGRRDPGKILTYI